MQRRLFFDLDGTLVNSQGRLYRLFRELCPECVWSYDEYWRIKRNRLSQAEMLKRYFSYDADRIARFHELWMAHVEDKASVLTDTPVPGAAELIQDLSDNNQIVILTCRQRRDLVDRQIDLFRWRPFVSEIAVVRSKSDYLKNVTPAKSDMLIGDTGEDIRTAQSFGMKSVAVAWGILSREVLAEYRPDALAVTVEDLKRIIGGMRNDI